MRIPRWSARSASACSWAASSSSSTASGGDRGADQHGVGAEAGHDVELVLGAAQVARRGGRVGRVEVAEGLVEVDRQAEVGAAGGQLGRGPRRGDQVGLEELDAVEPGRRGGVELVLQRAGQADGGDRRCGSAERGLRRGVDEARRSAASIRSASGSTPVNSRNASAAWKHGHAAAVEHAAAPRRGRRRPARSPAAGRRPRPPTARGAAGRAGTGEPGWAAMPVGVACTSPSARPPQRPGRRGRRPRPARADRSPGRPRAPRPGRGRRRARSARPAQGQQGVGDRGAGPARPEQHDPVERGVGQPAAKSGRTRTGRCCARPRRPR